MDAKEAKTKLERFDQWQQHRRWSAVAMATVKKFQEDQTTNLAGLIAFWAFFSVFPLMLAFATILGYVNAPASTMKKVSDILPVLKDQKFDALTGSWLALLVGVLSALWSGMGVVRTTQSAFSSVWEIPMNERPKFVEKTVRSLKILFTVGLGLVLSTVVTSTVTSTVNTIGSPVVSRIIGYVIALALDIGLFVAAFRMLTDREITLKQVLPGAILSGTVFWILQLASSWIISNRLSSAQGTYGKMATVIVILWWFYIQAIVTLLGAQLNVVLTNRLWPRSLVGGPDTRADHEAYQAYAQERTYHDNEEVDTTFHPTSSDQGRG
jgi:membrane protein